MTDQPSLATDRLLLRPFQPDDAALVQTLAGDKRIAEMAAKIPHPYADGVAEAWISGLHETWSNRTQATFAVTLRHSDQLIGAVSLMNISNGAAEIGYWIGVPYWNQGYCTEAVDALIGFGITSCDLTCIRAYHLIHNPASGKVLKNVGLQKVGKKTVPGRDGGPEQSAECYEMIISNDMTD
jgi:[ribosomal protein S5]-alanine N-acetyltransferase